MATKRCPYGGGSIKKNPSGTWRAQIMDGYRPDGKRNIVSFSGRTKADVKDKINRYWQAKEQGELTKLVKTPFDQWADTWYADYQTQVQPSTYCNYQYTLKVLKNYFGARAVEDIKPMDVNMFNNFMLNASMSKSYITKCRSMLIQILDAAEANEIISSNPARKSMSVKVLPTLEDEDVSKKDAFTDEEQTLLRKHLPDNMTGHTVKVMLGTGVRTQEVLALFPEDIAEDGSTVSISKAIKMVNGVPTLGPPKSRKGKRVVPVPEDYRTDALYLREHSGKPYVWTSKRENGLFDVGAFRRRYYTAIKKIPGVRPLSPHCCRHTYISNLEKKGVPMEQIARLAGHSRISTTDGYVHADMATLSNAVAVLNNT